MTGEITRADPVDVSTWTHTDCGTKVATDWDHGFVCLACNLPLDAGGSE